MRWDIWLAQSRTADSLRAIVRIAICLCGLWTLAVFYSLWSTESGLTSTQARVSLRQKQVAEMAVSFRQRRQDSFKADGLKTAPPDGPGSAEFTDEIIAVANAAGATVVGARVGGNEAAAAAAAAAPAPPAAPNVPGGAAVAAVVTPASPAPVGTGAGTAGGWVKAPLECTVEGRYQSLMQFMERLAASPRLFDISSVQLVRTSIDPQTGALRLQMKFSGVLYGLPEKS